MEENSVDDNSTLFLMLTRSKSTSDEGLTNSIPEVRVRKSEKEITWRKINDEVVLKQNQPMSGIVVVEKTKTGSDRDLLNSTPGIEQLDVIPKLFDVTTHILKKQTSRGNETPATMVSAISMFAATPVVTITPGATSPGKEGNKKLEPLSLLFPSVPL
ncbi:hypothetical protein MLD38_005052 [Melastoma candidum]|uniref:Uncharacterized protein n=1 Tax=Melastoma candidum TaxID=119954 RepID=A0ACB9S975_9MYRT|nr:hypothetical protein MLD38_005052 [Melastoma candidum]